MRYFKRSCEEKRGDQYDSWGCAIYYFEIDDSFSVVRQIEVYDNGNVLNYDQDNVKDQYGMLSDIGID
jgi:hypothetical protein